MDVYGDHLPPMLFLQLCAEIKTDVLVKLTTPIAKPRKPYTLFLSVIIRNVIRRDTRFKLLYMIVHQKNNFIIIILLASFRYAQ